MRFKDFIIERLREEGWIDRRPPGSTFSRHAPDKADKLRSIRLGLDSKPQQLIMVNSLGLVTFRDAKTKKIVVTCNTPAEVEAVLTSDKYEVISQNTTTRPTSKPNR